MPTVGSSSSRTAMSSSLALARQTSAVPVEEPLEIGEQEASLGGQLRDPAIDCI